jgi:threonine/homoserine/homoserine lactone efflux protein
VSATAIDSSYLAFFSFTFILVVTPGSTTAVVVRNTLEGARRAGYVTALGAAAANSIIAIACGIGLSAMSPRLLDAVRIGGALFLAWLGATSLWRAWSKPDGGIRLALDPAAAPPRDRGPQRAGSARWGGSHAAAYFGDGLAINLLSPVIISYYLSVVPSFIPANAPRFYYSGLAATHVGLAMLCHAMWATTLDAMRRWFVQPGRRKLLQALTGVALIALAIRILL